jgi:hypothetical protein
MRKELPLLFFFSLTLLATSAINGSPTNGDKPISSATIPIYHEDSILKMRLIMADNSFVWDNEKQADSSSPNYLLQTTHFPVVKIYFDQKLSDSLRIPAKFFLYTPEGDVYEEHCGVKYRGGFSKEYPKKSISLELWESDKDQIEKNVSLLNMRYDGDWILLAMYNEPLRLRNHLGHLIWSKIYRLTEDQKKRNAKLHIETRYVELFLNDRYKGLYLLGEKIDRKQLGIEKVTTLARGQLYKAIDWDLTTFNNIKKYDNASPIWGGFEQKYPKPQFKIDWHPFYSFVNFVVNRDENNFLKEIEGRLAIDNSIDFFLFINFLRATDNTGKNIYYARWDSHLPYFIIPWDLDGILGRKYDGSFENYYGDVLSNALFDRLFLNCTSHKITTLLIERWMELRYSLYCPVCIETQLFKIYQELAQNGSYEREEYLWPGSIAKYAEEKKKLIPWVMRRVEALDHFLFSLCGGEIEKEIRQQRIQFSTFTSNEVKFMSNGFNEENRIQFKTIRGQKIVSAKIKPGFNSLIINDSVPLNIAFVILDGKIIKGLLIKSNRYS